MKKSELGFLPLLLALLVITSTVSLAYAYLQSSVGDRQARARNLEDIEMAEEAMTEYKNLVQFLGTVSMLKNHFEDEYSDAMIAQLRLLYQMEKYDEAVELSDICVQEGIKDIAAVYFWSGNAFFGRGINEPNSQDKFAWFNRAQDQYRAGLEKDSEQRWNLRFNYELLRTAVEQAEADEEDKPIKLLRPEDLRQADAKIAG